MSSTRDGSTRSRGQGAEREAAEFLRARGLEILDINVHVGGGELDLIARILDADPPTVVFVEVRSRQDTRRGTPLETIGRRKRAHLIRAATAWLVERGLWEQVAVRFDVVGIVVGERRPEQRVEWIPNAFTGD